MLFVIRKKGSPDLFWHPLEAEWAGLESCGWYRGRPIPDGPRVNADHPLPDGGEWHPLEQAQRDARDGRRYVLRHADRPHLFWAGDGFGPLGHAAQFTWHEMQTVTRLAAAVWMPVERASAAIATDAVEVACGLPTGFVDNDWDGHD